VPWHNGTMPSPSLGKVVKKSPKACHRDFVTYWTTGLDQVLQSALDFIRCRPLLIFRVCYNATNIYRDVLVLFKLTITETERENIK